MQKTIIADPDNTGLSMLRHGCVSPTRIARHGAALMPGVKGERINLKNARFKEDAAPVDEACDCYCCRNFSRAYVHHLIKAEALLGMQLLTQHNIAVMNRLMRDVQAAIPEGNMSRAQETLGRGLGALTQ